LHALCDLNSSYSYLLGVTVTITTEQDGPPLGRAILHDLVVVLERPDVPERDLAIGKWRQVTWVLEVIVVGIVRQAAETGEQLIYIL